jgi:hypothetical protein
MFETYATQPQTNQGIKNAISFRKFLGCRGNVQIVIILVVTRVVGGRRCVGGTFCFHLQV